jgi:mannan endo-1,4-beta-mannosidase
VTGNRARLASRVSVAVALVVVSAGVAAALYARGFQDTGTDAALTQGPVQARPLSTRHPYMGVFQPGAIDSYTPVTSFGRAVGLQPSIVLYYSGWNDPFQIRLAEQAFLHHAIPFVQMMPKGLEMSSVAAGKYDRYLDSYARSVRAYGRPVILSFAPEANGWWYKWSFGQTPAAQWIAAWRHVVTLFQRQGATNATWMWTINRGGGPTGPVRDWWPGARYVNWVGIDGYYFRKGDNFDGLYGPTIRAVHRLTSDPVFLSEVGIGQITGQAAGIPNLFAGIRKYHLLGLVWFDVTQHAGIYHQDWRLEDHSAGMAAFHKGAQAMLSQHEGSG